MLLDNPDLPPSLAEERFIQIMERMIDLSCKRLPDDVYAKLG